MSQFCPSLPSSQHAYELLRTGSPSSAITTVGTTLLRAVLIGIGIYAYTRMVAKDMPVKEVAVNSIAGAVSIEAFVLAYLALRMHAHGGGR